MIYNREQVYCKDIKFDPNHVAFQNGDALSKMEEVQQQIMRDA